MQKLYTPYCYRFSRICSLEKKSKFSICIHFPDIDTGFKVTKKIQRFYIRFEISNKNAGATSLITTSSSNILSIAFLLSIHPVLFKISVIHSPTHLRIMSNLFYVMRFLFSIPHPQSIPQDIPYTDYWFRNGHQVK